MRTPSKNCALCEGPVSLLGAFVQLSQGKLAHLLCLTQRERQQGFEEGQRVLLARIAEEKRIEQERAAKDLEAGIAYERAEQERRAEIAERERTNRIMAAQKMPLPPLLQAPKQEVKKDAPKEEDARERKRPIEID